MNRWGSRNTAVWLSACLAIFLPSHYSQPLPHHLVSAIARSNLYGYSSTSANLCNCLTLREEGGRDGLEELADFEKTRRRSVAQQQSLCGSALLLAALVTATILVTAFVISQISLATLVNVLNRFGCQRHGATWTRYSIFILSNTPTLFSSSSCRQL